MRSEINALIVEKTLSHLSSGSDLPENMYSATNFKNVCAKVAPQVADDIDNICGLLSISKRRFVEAALLSALDEAKRIMREEGLLKKGDE